MMLAVPVATAVATPLLPEVLLTVATATFEELHVAELARFLFEPSL